MESEFGIEKSIMEMVDQDPYQIVVIIINKKVIWLLIICSLMSLLRTNDHVTKVQSRLYMEEM